MFMTPLGSSAGAVELIGKIKNTTYQKNSSLTSGIQNSVGKMGRRHQLNATNSSCYTYYERKKDAEASGYGSDRMRLGKDSIKEFDCCSLTLQPCRKDLTWF